MKRPILAISGFLLTFSLSPAVGKESASILHDGAQENVIAAGQAVWPASPQPTSPVPTPVLRGPVSFPQGSNETQQIPSQILQPASMPSTVPSAVPSAMPPALPSVKGTVNYSTNQPEDPQEGLSLSQALDEALMKGPRASAIRSQLPIAKSQIAQAARSPNPAFFYDDGYIAEATIRRGTAMTWDPPWQLAFRLLAATRVYAQTKIDLMANLWQLRADARRAYTELIVAQETQKTLADLFQLTQRLLEVSSKRFQAGDVPELDLLRARLATSQSQIDLGVGIQRVIRARQQLNIIMGRNVLQPISVPQLPIFIGQKPTIQQLKAVKRGVLPDFSRVVPPLPYFLNKGQENRLELKSLEQQVKANKANYMNAIAQIAPNPSVAYGSSKSGNLPTGPRLAGNFLTLNIQIPVSDANQDDIAKFKATGRQLAYQLGAQRNQISSEVSSAYNNLVAARDRIKVYQEHVLSDSSEVARLSRRSYEVGQSDINATLLAQQANIQIRSQYLDAITNYQQAYTDLEQACGTPLE